MVVTITAATSRLTARIMREMAKLLVSRTDGTLFPLVIPNGPTGRRTPTSGREAKVTREGPFLGVRGTFTAFALEAAGRVTVTQREDGEPIYTVTAAGK